MPEQIEITPLLADPRPILELWERNARAPFWQCGPDGPVTAIVPYYEQIGINHGRVKTRLTMDSQGQPAINSAPMSVTQFEPVNMRTELWFAIMEGEHLRSRVPLSVVGSIEYAKEESCSGSSSP